MKELKCYYCNEGLEHGSYHEHDGHMFCSQVCIDQQDALDQLKETEKTQEDRGKAPIKQGTMRFVTSANGTNDDQLFLFGFVSPQGADAGAEGQKILGKPKELPAIPTMVFFHMLKTDPAKVLSQG